jgi:hypothetical protein
MPSPEELAREKIDPLLQQCGWILIAERAMQREGSNKRIPRNALSNAA